MPNLECIYKPSKSSAVHLKNGSIPTINSCIYSLRGAAFACSLCFLPPSFLASPSLPCLLSPSLPSFLPSVRPSFLPSVRPSFRPSVLPSALPSLMPETFLLPLLLACLLAWPHHSGCRCNYSTLEPFFKWIAMDFEGL